MKDMEYIKIDHTKGLPDEQAEDAYKNGYYVEAIQILHTWIECQARGLLIAMANETFNAESKEIWDIADSFSLSQALKIFLMFNQITKDEYNDFNELNSLRNKIVHRIFKEPYNEIYEGVPKSEYDKVFKRMLRQAYFFTEKNEQYYCHT